MPPLLLADLPADVVQHILVRLTLAHNIARAAPTCKVVSVAVRNAIRVRKFSSEVVMLAGHTNWVMCVAAAPDGRVIAGSYENTPTASASSAPRATTPAASPWPTTASLSKNLSL